jgi:hypothetical protein
LSANLTMDKFKDYVDYILSVTGYVIAWVNKTARGIVQKLFGLNPEFVEETDQVNCSRNLTWSTVHYADDLLGC